MGNDPAQRLKRLATRRNLSWGQAIPEFALVLPVLLVILLITVDFGRLFASWVAINNATRVAANYAGAAPTSAFGPGSTYDVTVRNESNLSGCTLPTVSSPTFAPDTKVGSTATVTLTCQFQFLTPLIGNLVGNPMNISATSIFTVRSGTVAGVPVVPPPPCVLPNRQVPNLVGLTMTAARAAWTAAGFTGSFSPSGSPNKIVTGQVPDVGACRAQAASVVVTHT